jgi:hypothetical protein
MLVSLHPNNINQDGYSPCSSWKVSKDKGLSISVSYQCHHIHRPICTPQLWAIKKVPSQDYHHISPPTQSHCWPLKKLFSCSLITSVKLLLLGTSSHWLFIVLHLKKDNSYKHFWESEWGIMPGKLKILYMSLPNQACKTSLQYIWVWKFWT